MNKYLLLFITLTFIFLKTTKSQVSINIGGQFDDPQFLVDEVLLGVGVVASNFSYMGDSIQVGTFDASSSNLGISSGVVIGTGDIRSLDPNFTAFTGFVNVSPVVQDPDLLAVANSVPGLIGESFVVNSINDVAVLEFDFVASSDTLSFDYIFGSSEYFLFENTSFNDVFGFFISGPGIVGPYSSPTGFPNGSVNIAVVPESSPELPITVSSVNSFLNPSFFVANQGFTTVASVRGFTTPIEARALVQCGETYHIRLAIADGSDSGLSSFIFLSSNSFNSPEVLVSNSLDGQLLTDLEIPCNSNVDLIVQLPYLQGYDFNWNTGDTTQSISVSEGDYWVTITNDQNCSFSSIDTIKVRYKNQPSFSLEDDLKVCSGDNILLKVDTIISGTPPYNYYWSNGYANEEITVSSGTYHLTLTDANDCSAIDSVTISELIRPNANLLGEISQCFDSDDELTMNFQFTGEPPFIVNYGLYQNQFIDTTNLSSFYKVVDEVGVYSIFQFKDNLCSGNFNGEGKINKLPSFSSSISGNKEICFGEDAILEVNVDGRTPPYDITITNQFYNVVIEDVSMNPFRLSIKDTALYTAYIEDENGCKSDINHGSAHVTYKALNEPNIIPPIQTDFCQVDSAIELFSDLEGGTWSGKGITTDGLFVPVNAIKGEGYIYYTYPENCNEGDSVLFTVGCDYNIFFPDVFTPNGDGINDAFRPQSNNVLEFSLDIFDRWGSLIYSTNDITLLWDGTFKGRLVPLGDYTYMANFYAKNAKFYNKIGTVSVIY